MLYKNKIKVQNILKSAVALMLMLTLSLSTALSPLAKAEEARYTWKNLTSVPGYRMEIIYMSPDGSKLFAMERDAAHSTTDLWMSADDGATWRKIFSKQISVTTFMGGVSISTDGSKIVLRDGDYFGISTDGGQSWMDKGPEPEDVNVRISPDGSFLARCDVSGGATVFTTYISTDDGQTWTQKGTNNISCPRYVSNNGTLIAQNGGDLARSTDYGQTWTETPDVLNVSGGTAFSNNGNNIFDEDRISLDGGNHWTPSNAPIPAGYEVLYLDISDDGKKLFAAATSIIQRKSILLTSVDGGRTWHSEDDAIGFFDRVIMSSNGSKLLYVRNDGVYRLGTLPTSQPVTPGAGAGGVATPSTGSTSATPGQKPGKASGRLAETGASTWMVGGLAVVTVAAGVLVLRKRL
jgi:hypothetical protein